MHDSNKNLSYKEREIELIRHAVDNAEKMQAKELFMTTEITELIDIVELFLKKKKRVCYGGTAINNILPKEDQFYNKELEIPDYDFFSPDPIKDAIELADMYYKKGFEEVEAKSGAHYGTYKVFVNFIPIADITYINTELYKNIYKEKILVDGIAYTPPNFLRMSMYLELSRPKGDVSRWEKVLKRLILLNKHFPLKSNNCKEINIQRLFEDISLDSLEEQKKIYFILRESFIDQGLIFFGAYANSLYLEKLPVGKRHSYIPDFDILSEDPLGSCKIVKERLEDAGITDININKKKSIGELIDEHYEIKIGNETVAFIYKPNACHSYNVIKKDGKSLRIASVNTMFSFFLTFLYADRKYFDKERILCMCETLFKIQQKNRLKQKGILKRFPLVCYGRQISREQMRAEKSKKYEELKNKRSSKEFKKWFFRYIPKDGRKNMRFNYDNFSKTKTKKKSKINTTVKSRSKNKSKKKSKTRKKNI